MLKRLLSFQWRISLAVAVAMMLSCVVGRAQVSDTFANFSIYNSIANINATNFLNDNGATFSVNPGLGSGWLADLYQAWRYTRNFTNNGEMDSFTGFRFDTLISQHNEAANFFNAGNINCGSSSNAIFIINGIGSLLLAGGYGGIQVWSTNIFNSGTITVGADGLARIYGHNIDFTRGTMTMQNSFLNQLFGFTNTFTIYATGQTGRNTNGLWFPDSYLQPGSAISSLPLQVFLPNSKPYFDVQPDPAGTNVIVRMVFLENDLTNVPCNVYFRSGFGNGFTTIEWVGSYTDPITGLPGSHYVYLTDDYVQGSSTNILNYISPGIPNNYGFFEQTTPLLLGVPQPTNYPSIGGFGQPFPPGQEVNTNIYSYVNAQLVASTVSTNSVVGGAITNLPGRFELVASNELNLSLATLSGMNYLLLKSTNNYDNDGQSLISSPYSDVYLGRTNNSIVISNLLLSGIPIWNGSIQGWNTRWFYTDTNLGITYDYRVLLVRSALTPTSASQQQDFVLYSSNNATISDVLNISRTFYANCTNLLLTTNTPGYGAAAFDGELNLNSTSISWATSTPRLRKLTNNGAIRTTSVARFGSASTPYLSFYNSGIVSNSAGSFISALTVENYGIINAGVASFAINSLFTTMTNSSVLAAGSFTNVSSTFVISNTTITVGKSITLTVTNLLTDGDSISNFWATGFGNVGIGNATGLVLPIRPAIGDLHGTTITNTAVTGSLVNNQWAAADFGYSNAGYTNNASLGYLVLDAQGPNPHTGLYFTGIGGVGVTNALYVDCLQLVNYASYTNRQGHTNLPALTFNTNLVIYYAQALTGDGVSVAEAINHFNGDHLRWVPAHIGYFSVTNIVYPDGSTNAANAALAQSSDIDSDGDGIPNGSDPTPFFVQSQLNFDISLTNLPPKAVQLQWMTVANATNYIYYKTNLLSPNWLPFTAFGNYYFNNGQALTNAAHTNCFPSPQPYFGPATNVWLFDNVTNVQRYYRVLVQPWITGPNGI